jgi:hypothetical protein
MAYQKHAEQQGRRVESVLRADTGAELLEGGVAVITGLAAPRQAAKRRVGDQGDIEQDNEQVDHS